MSEKARVSKKARERERERERERARALSRIEAMRDTDGVVSATTCFSSDLVRHSSVITSFHCEQRCS